MILIYTEAIHIPTWQGSIGFTHDDYPYLHTPSLVKVYFPKPILSQCVLVQQLGKTDVYDWSIARIRLLRADQLE